MKIFAYALRSYDELEFMEAYSKEAGFEFDWTEEYPSFENAQLAEGADALSILTNPMTPEYLDLYHSMGIKAIATRSIGYDHIDLAYAHKLGIRIAHAVYPPEGVANYSIMMMLMGLRKAKLILEHAAIQNFALRGKIGKDISSCTVGIIGTGAIGACVIRHLQGFGCKILAHDPYPKQELESEGLARYVELDELLSQSDLVSLHAPALPENHHMLSTEKIARMPKGAVIVNAARGSLIDSEALIAALESGHLGGAVLDTIENETGLYYLDKSQEILANRQRAILQTMPNVIISPHMAFYTREDVHDMVYTSTSALLAFEKGEESPYEVS